MATHISSPVRVSAHVASQNSAQTQSVPQISDGLRRYAWLVVGYNILVILWGAVVRSTGSGNGCGEHWPLCGGTVVQHWKTVASVIEFAHRASSGIAGMLTMLLLVWAWRGTPRRHLARVFVTAAAVLTINEGFLGALLVELGLTGTNQSPMRAVFLSLHFANTLLMLAALALTAHFLARRDARMRGGVQINHAAVALVGLGATLCVGVSGSLAALGDTLYPAHSLAEAFAQDFSRNANWLLHIRWIHPTLSFLAGAWILFLVIKSRDEAGSRTLGNTVAGLVGLQIVLGTADVLLLAPTWLQVMHLLGADLVWIGLVVLTAKLCVRPVGCPGGGALCSSGKRSALEAAQARTASATSVATLPGA